MINPFKVGDKVVCIKADAIRLELNKIYTVLGVNEKYYHRILLEF